MKGWSALMLAMLLLTLSLGMGCKKSDNPDLSKLGPSSAATTTVLPVGSANCPGGGIGIYSGGDKDANGVLDAAEFEKGEPVCLPEAAKGETPGKKSTLVMIISEPSGTMHCPAGGLKVLSGADGNGNNVLEAGEASYTEYLCNGAPGSSSMAGMTVVVGPVGAVSEKGKKNGKKELTGKKQATGAGAKAAPKQAKEAKNDKAAEKSTQAASKKEKAAAKPAAPPSGWTNVKVNAPELGSVAYKFDKPYITLRFKNLSDTLTARFKYVVRWKANQNGKWVDDASPDGMSVRLRPQSTLDRDVRTSADEVRDVVVDVDVMETN